MPPALPAVVVGKPLVLFRPTLNSCYTPDGPGMSVGVFGSMQKKRVTWDRAPRIQMASKSKQWVQRVFIVAVIRDSLVINV